jgi:hypothetical protein
VLIFYYIFFIHVHQLLCEVVGCDRQSYSKEEILAFEGTPLRFSSLSMHGEKIFDINTVLVALEI